MNIKEATNKAIKINGVMRRETVTRTYGDIFTVVKPTNSHDLCILIVVQEGGKKIRSASCWNPTADDLTANDWTVLRDKF